MDIRQLRYFIAIVENGAFSRAAESLHVAQPALSLHVRNMEASLGTPLLFRGSRGVVPTEAGQILLRHARIVLDQIEVAKEEIRGHENDPAGEVRIGLTGTISQTISVPLITAARKRYPKVKLLVAEAMSGFVLDWLRDGRVDLAVLYAEAEKPHIEAQRLLDEALVFFTPPDFDLGTAVDPEGNISFSDVVKVPLILPSEGHGLRDLLVRIAARTEVQIQTITDVDSYSNIKELVFAGIGCSILPRDAIKRELADGRLRAYGIRNPAVTRSMFLGNATGHPMTNAVRAIRNLTIETMLDLVDRKVWDGVTIVADCVTRR